MNDGLNIYMALDISWKKLEQVTSLQPILLNSVSANRTRLWGNFAQHMTFRCEFYDSQSIPRVRTLSRDRKLTLTRA